ncbi:MAG: chromate transporter [Ruminococcaceae bacterium]|nr:chromate transporter [Oscillospiraceae bacterium]
MIFWTLFIEFFKIGLFTIGGGYAMIPLVKEAVLNYNWLTESEFYDFIGICESTPGPIAVNMATFVGAGQGGILGGICATLGVILPAFLIILIIASVLKNLTENKYFKGFISGVKPVVVALITSTGLLLLVKCIGFVSIKEFDFNVVSTICFAVITAIYFAYKRIAKKKMSAIMLIVISALLGLLISIILR